MSRRFWWSMLFGAVLAYLVVVADARAQGGPPPPVAPIVGEWAFQFPEGELLVSSGPHIRCYGSPLDDWREWVDAPNCYAEAWPSEAEPAVYPCDGGYLDLDPDAYNGGGCWIYGLDQSQAECIGNPVYNPEDYSFTWGEACAVYDEPTPVDPPPDTDPLMLRLVEAAEAAAVSAGEASAMSVELRQSLVALFWLACGGLGFFGYSVGSRDA